MADSGIPEIDSRYNPESSHHQPNRKPYTAHKPVPTIAKYQEELKRRAEAEDRNDREQEGRFDEPVQDEGRAAGEAHDGKLTGAHEFTGDGSESWVELDDEESPERKSGGENGGKLQHGKKHHREVMDPITHLPIMTHDYTSEDLKKLHLPREDNYDERNKEGDSLKRHSVLEKLVKNELKSDAWLEDEQQKLQYEIICLVALGAGLGTIAAIMIATSALGLSGFISLNFAGLSGLAAAIGAGVLFASRLRPHFEAARSTGDADGGKAGHRQESTPPETPLWLNSLFESVWPLVNPDLFVGLCDTLEDVMQASLPKLVEMVRVADLGQGNEPVRILGIKWLRDGDATVSKEGLEAEEGDFINLEIAFAYKAKKSGKSVRSKTKNAHLLIEFYMLKGSVALPVWVELKGIIGTARIRLQLTPDPPFFSLMTLTFLGQPKVSASCVPLMQRFPNIMNLPIISHFIQNSIDASMAQYVAPKSMTMDLKQMLMGDDFKWDTTARGVVVFRVIKAAGIKQGDSQIKVAVQKAVRTLGRRSGEDGGDNYVSVSWAKLNKPMWSSRIIKGPLEPTWDELGVVMVTPMELNAKESLKLQVWDSDRMTADDHIGTVQVPLEELFTNPASQGKMQLREDRLKAVDIDDDMPGTLTWEVGYFPKLSADKHARSKEDREPLQALKRETEKETERKMREADLSIPQKREELDQQKKQDVQEALDKHIVSNAPHPDFPSGILALQIHNIAGLEIEKQNKPRGDDEAGEEEQEGDDLPSSYCTIVVNHRRVFRTRTKPKTNQPFFNAGTEQFIADWRTAEVMIAVRDQRSSEDDALLGVVVLDLRKMFEQRTQHSDLYPLAGGIGYGRMKVSMVFRSVELQLPKNMTGWEIGTVQIQHAILSKDLPKEFGNYRLKARVVNAKGRFTPSSSFTDDQTLGWTSTGRNHKPKAVHIPVAHRYCQPLVLEFRKSLPGPDHTPYFSIFWLKDIPDSERRHVVLPVWKAQSDIGLKDADAGNLREFYGESDKPIGHIELDLTFWPGLSGYHSKIATARMRGVMEELDAAEDAGTVSGHESIDAGGSSSSDNETEDEQKSIEKRKLANDGKRSTLDEMKEYKMNAKQLHRRHRGIMQWKGARTLGWMASGIKHSGEKIKEGIRGKTRGKGGEEVETEV